MGFGKHPDQVMISQSIHKSRQEQIFGSKKRVAKKQCRHEHVISTKKHSPSSVNLIKKKLRDVTRRLKRSENIPAGLRIEDERAQAAYLQELATAEAEKKKQRMIKKYHMVRFFERQKASRLVKKFRKQLLSADCPKTIDSLKKQLHEAEVDLNYTLYHPLSEVYISLYPNLPSLKADSEETGVLKQKPLIWFEIESAMENGGLENIRNRASPRPVVYSKQSTKIPPSEKAKKYFNENVSKHQPRRAQCSESREKKSQVICQDPIPQSPQPTESEENDDSDEGFFE